MRITIDILKKYFVLNERYPALNNDIKLFEEKYPNGIEFLDLTVNDFFTIERFHLFYRYLDLNAEEKDHYRKICEIDDDSSNFWDSTKIIKSNSIVRSSSVTSSKFVSDSKDIFKSNKVYNSESILKSHEILNSKKISNSSKVINSSDVDDSFNIQNCNHIGWSRNLLNSNYIEDSGYVYNSNNTNGTYCSGFLSNCNYCLFCSGLSDKSYYIFNKQVGQNIYEKYREELLERLSIETSDIIIVNDFTALEQHTSISNRLDNIFNGLSDDFFEWVKTLPNYDDFLANSIFFKKGRK